MKDWFAKPRYGRNKVALMLACGHIKWARITSPGPVRRIVGRPARCDTCGQNGPITDVLDWSWIAG